MAVPVAPGRLPLLGHTVALLRHRYRFTSQLYRHGEVVRLYLGPMETHFVTSPELTQQVLVAQANRFAKGIMFDKFRPYLGNGLILSEGSFHRRQRRLIQPAFRHDHLTRYVDVMARVATRTAVGWRPGDVRQIDREMQSLAVTIVGETLFSAELGNRVVDEAQRSIPIVIKQGMVRALSPSFAERLPVQGNRRFDEAITRMRSVVLDIIAERRADPVDHGDLLSMLLTARDSESGDLMTDRQVHDEVLTMLTAGVETTALALAWAFHELGRHPDVRERLHAEVDEVLAGGPVTAAAIRQLRYTRQVANEVLRIYPIWILMRRATERVQLGHASIEPGGEVIVSPHALHFDPRWHDDPHRFDPDRWAPDRAGGLPEGAFIPFGGGLRQCIGNHFALTEIVVTLAVVSSRWRLEPVVGMPVRTKFTSAAYPSRMPMTAIPRHP